MTHKEAIKILMLSPLYFRMKLSDRKRLVVEFCAMHTDIMQR